jgi:membrane dipeptidase
MTRFVLLVSVLLLSWQPGRTEVIDASLERAKQLLSVAPIVDGHNDLPWVIREKFGSDVEGYDISKHAEFDTDIPRLREGRIGTQFWSVYVPSSLTPLEAMTAQLEQIDLARRMIGLYPDDLMLATSVADVEAARAQGKIASLLGMEGGHAIVNSLGALRSYYQLGVRYMTLTHFHGNDWADSATDVSRHEGITDFGREVVREMNRIGMMVDLSHVSTATMNDVLDIAEAPVIFSHSSARALTDHARNVPDDVLKRMKANGGVVMVTFIPQYVNDERRQWEDGMIPLLKNAKTDAEWEAAGIAFRKEHGAAPIASYSLDAVLFGTVTQSQFFPPQKLSVSVDMVAAETGLVIWSSTVHLDATEERVRDGLEAYFSNTRGVPEDAAQDWRLALLSPSRFAQFAAFQVASLL